MTPVKITFILRTPVHVPNRSISLDGLLCAARVKRAEFEGHEDPWSIQHDIGIDRYEFNGQWCHKASNLQFEWAGEASQIYYTKKQEIGEYSDAWMKGILKKKPAFDSSIGPTRGGLYLSPIRWTTQVYGYAIIDDAEKLKQLMPWITHIGKRRHHDFGAIKDYKIEECREASDLWTKRNLPAGSPLATSHAPSIDCLRTPYWRRDNLVEVMAPI